MEDYTIVNFIPKPNYKTIDLEMLEYCRKDFDFLKILSKTINNMNTIKIEIPEGKVAHVEYIGNKINVTFEDKKLVKVIKHYNDGSIEIEERT